MKSLMFKISKRSFVRSVFIVASGTAAAQIITILFSPIITRMYGPEAFGILGVFMAIVSILSQVSALAYPTAIVLPKSNEYAKALIRLSLIISLMLSAVFIVVLWNLSSFIGNALHLQEVTSYLYLLPLVIIFSSLHQVANQWLIRTKQFTIIAKVSFYQALLVNFSKVGFGFLNPVASVLVIITSLGSASHALMLIIGIKKNRKKTNNDDEKTERISLFEVAKSYKEFPLYSAPQVFVNAITHSIPILLLTSFFGPASAGFYTLSRTVLNMPTQLIGKSVGEVFYPKIAESKNNDQPLTPLLIKATLALASIAIIPYGIIFVAGPWIFEFVFGAAWISAGEYSRWLALWLFFMFINKPCIVAIPVLNLQKGFLIYEIISLIFRVLILVGSTYLFNNDVISVVLFSISGVLSYVCLIIWVLLKSRQKL